ncbi:MAG: ribosomal protein S18-alanine N-acetyltransferase [Clostridiales bacterium]|nr:ribosomal protein S18-alanine N-acetyltransferase [Clostridiales bacterium]
MINVRRMEENDLKEVYSLEKVVFTMPWSYKSFADTLKLPNTIYLVAEKQGDIVGYIGIWKILDEGDVTNIAVRADSRNQGIGQLLISEAISIAKNDGIKDLTLEVRKSNQSAIFLYEKNGFENVGIRPGFYEQPKEDAIIMWKWDI